MNWEKLPPMIRGMIAYGTTMQNKDGEERTLVAAFDELHPEKGWVGSMKKRWGAPEEVVRGAATLEHAQFKLMRKGGCL